MPAARLDLRAAVVPRTLRWVVLTLLVLLAASRAPYVLTHGRFWAEEGTLHFANMYEGSFPGELFYVQTRTGYYNLFANLASWVASYVSLDYAPRVTAWLSFGVVVLLAWIALAWPSDLLTTVGAKLAAATLLVIGTLAVAEVWLNTINAQTYLGLTALLLLFVRVEQLNRLFYVLGLALLVVAGLSGLYAVVLTPLFVIVAVLDKSRRRWGYALTLTGAAIAQIAVVISTGLTGEVAESKFALPGFGEAARSVAGWQLGGVVLGRRIGRVIDSAADGSVGATLTMALLALAVLGLVALLLWRAPNRRVPLLLVGAMALTEVLVQIGGLGGETISRYTVVPIGILTLMLIYGVTTSPLDRFAWAGAMVLGAALIVGLSQFWTLQSASLRCRGCPDWAAEVEQYDTNGDPLLIWPYDRAEPWVMYLEPRK